MLGDPPFTMITSPNFNISLHVGPKSKHHFYRNKRHAGDGHDDVAWNDVCAYNAPPDASVPQDPGSMGRDKGRGKPLPWEVGWIHVTLSLFSETLTTAAQRAGGTTNY